MDIFDLIDTKPKEDIFDRIIWEKKPDAIDRAQEMKTKEEALPPEIKSLIRNELRKVKPLEKVIERIIEKPSITTVNVPVEIKPKKEEKPQVIEITKIIEKKPDTKQLDELKTKIEAIKQELKDTREILPMLGGSGVLGLPSPQGSGGKFLTTDGNGFSWATVVTTGGSGPAQAYDVLTDTDANGNTIYIGHSLPGTATSAAGWRIRKLKYDVNNVFLGVVFPSSSDAFTFVWDNRTTYTYP